MNDRNAKFKIGLGSNGSNRELLGIIVWVAGIRGRRGTMVAQAPEVNAECLNEETWDC
jgi:hypothetical protein